jgi:hypothetical protein
MLYVHYKKVLFALCLCSLQTISCMEAAPDKDSVAPQGKSLSLNPIELASKYKLSQKAGTVFNATERVLRKTVDVAGKVTTQTLGFVWHHPFISLGITGAVLMYSPALRSYIYNTAWSKGFAHARATAREFLGLNEQDARLVRLEGASDMHTAQLGRIETASGLHTERLTELAEESGRHTEQLTELAEESGLHTERLTGLAEESGRHTEQLTELSAAVGAARGIAEDHTGRLDGLAAGLEGIRTSQRSFVDRIAHIGGLSEVLHRDVQGLRGQIKKLACLPTEITGLRQAVGLLGQNQARQFDLLREDLKSCIRGRQFTPENMNHDGSYYFRSCK